MGDYMNKLINFTLGSILILSITGCDDKSIFLSEKEYGVLDDGTICLLYTSPSPRD